MTNLNSYPFLDNKHKPLFTEKLAEIVPRVRRERVIDISTSPLVSAKSLREKLDILHQAGEVDGGLPIISNDVLVGLIPAPDLEYALDHLEDESNSLCLMVSINSFDSDDESRSDPTDFTPYIDPVSRSSQHLILHLSDADKFNRRPWLLISIRLWTWCTSVLSNSD